MISRMDRTITKLALNSRLVVILLQYVSNVIIPDHEAGVFVSPQNRTEYSSADKTVYHFLGGFLRWDAQYFMHIAIYGYTYENTLAFFPLYPLTVRFFAFVLYPILPSLSFNSTVLLTSIVLNIILFVFSAKLLYKLSAIIFEEDVAYKSTLLFIFNPASVFFSAPYSEFSIN
ncbi:hypothetical protein NQ315_000791 [Exocentrus adspersus]|uniref:GPI mannosyltransferase 2 n=1 Tax=Exocentrus adspersus TaxID=1586481 RepID=A0AAV8WD65_9CUCU|nr:hypothetical protein NQ315_000791 [Exocentrus adspersus]